MPGRLLDVLNRVVSRSESAKESKQQQQSDESNNNSTKKKVSFSKKVNFKPFKPRKKSRSGVQRDGNNVVARLQSSGSPVPIPARKSESSNKRDEGGSGRSVNAGGEFWFNVHRRTATSPSSSTGNITCATSGLGSSTINRPTTGLSASRPSISSLASDAHSAPYSPLLDKRRQTQLTTASLPTAAKRAARAKRGRAPVPIATIHTSSSNQMASPATYAYDVDPSLHDSQKPSQVPRVKRNLVRDIVDKFNEEAKKRGSTENLLSDIPARTTPPGIIEATPDNAPNHAIPFSYTVLGGSGSPTTTAMPPLVQQREYEMKASSPTNNEVIYAQVQVVNGQNGHHNGVHKTTVHTSVPRHQSPEIPAAPIKSTAKKLFSKSTGSLHRLDDNDENRLLDYQRKNKETDHSYYKFDQVDDQGDYSGRSGEDSYKPKVHQNGSANGNGISNGNTNGNYQHLSKPLPLRGGGRHTDSEGEDRISYQPLASRHHIVQLQEPSRIGMRSPVGVAGGNTSRNIEKWSENDGNTKRNVEKWSENEVGPNSKKFTAHEYIHEVSVSNDAEPLPPLQPPVSSIVRDPMLPLLSGSGLASDMSLKEKFNLLMRGDDRPLDHGVLTRSLSENKEDKSSREWSSYNTATSGRQRHREDQISTKENEARKTSTSHQQKSHKQTSNSLHRSKSRDDDKQEESIVWPPPRNRHRENDDLLLHDLKPTYYFGEAANEQPAQVRQERQVLKESSEKQQRHHHSTEKSSRQNLDKSKLEFRSTPLASRLGMRRNSNDSTGSGVGLLSSKLVKKANAEVNGYSIHDDNRNYRRHIDTTFDAADDDRIFRFDSGRGHFGSTSRLNSTIRDLDHRRPPSPLLADDTFGHIQSSPTAGRHGDYNTEHKRIYRREETHQKRHTRSSSQPRHATDAIQHTSGGASSPTRNLALKQRHDSSERSESRNKEREQKRHQQQLRSTRNEEDGTAYWNENTQRSQQSHHEKHHKKSTDVSEVERSTTTRHHRHGRQHSNSNRVMAEELDDKMETSESEPQLYGGSQDSQMSLGSRLSSTEEEELANESERRQQAQNIIAAHVNTPDSLVKQLNKKQISYENSQQHHSRHEQERTSTPTGRRLWFERVAADEVDGLERLDGNRNLRYSPQSLQHNDNSRWTGGSATMSRLETNKNRRNNVERSSRTASSTVDRRDTRRRRGDDVRILLNDHDIATLNGNGHVSTRENPVARSSSFNSRVGSYHSENESQHSVGSNTSNSRQKRVNFKASARNNGSSTNGGLRYSSAADLSPIHREALLRSASPARAPSITGSLRSNESDGSHASSRSVILHATAVADIPPARQYRARSAATSPAPSPSAEIGGRESRTVQRSFSLLSPWKSPRKYSKEKRRDSSESSGILKHQNGGSGRHHEAQQKQLARQQRKQQEGESISHNSSSERLDSLSPLQSEGSTPVKSGKSKKKSGILRRHSMPKDSRFANFFRRKKEAKTKEH